MRLDRANEVMFFEFDKMPELAPMGTSEEAHQEPAAWHNDDVCAIQVLPGWLGREDVRSLAAAERDLDWMPARLRYTVSNRETCDCAWLHVTPAHWWLYRRLTATFCSVNATYRFDLRGLNEAPRLLRYGPGASLDWHVDTADAATSVRKLALVALVERSVDCIGGELQFAATPRADILGIPGDAVVFPTFLTHRVLPVVQGRRISLVAWACGPAFR